MTHAFCNSVPNRNGGSRSSKIDKHQSKGCMRLSISY